jgi:fused signal recognition particle receptor
MSFLKIFSRSKISDQLKSSSNKISTAIAQIFTHKKLDALTLEELEEVLILSDMGSEVASSIIANLKARKFEKNIDENEIKNFLKQEIENILKPCQKALVLDESKKPQVIIFNGVNGAGKTTTIGKVRFENLELGENTC